ncbi:uncharacterized protein LOC135113742 isoform X2 [Scylla paramamosain]|uniref:uncharacterized protein LOC135113742 isoform X2 n=1 Tax=Scylla paramamosain TaxID=85552 RepID=UPI003082CA3D
MRVSLFLLSFLVAAASAGVTRTLTTLQAPEDTPTTTPITTTTTSSTSSSTPSESRTEESREEEEEEEERRVGVNGWLAAPTQAPATSSPQTEAPEKPGLCESPKGYGIRCMTRMDQCKHDQGCPSATKCCIVEECGKMCVKPKRKTAH